MSNKISNVTKRDIFNLFIKGMDVELLLGDTNHIFYPYYGSLSEMDFLKRLYNLNEMNTSDPRYKNAEEDIWHHLIMNDDYECGWIFRDERFPLKTGTDEDILCFLCEIFHPEVRDEKGYWNEYLNEVNRLLANDDFELYPINQISNHYVYGWRNKSMAKFIYLPFSLRFKNLIDSKQLKFSIKKDCREQIVKAMELLDETLYLTDNTGWNYNSTISKEAFGKISSYYEPKCYNDENKYVKAENIFEFINRTRPYCVFDAIEAFSSNNLIESEFSSRINAILLMNKLPYSLNEGIIQGTHIIAITDEQIGATPEVGVTELLQKAQNCYNNGKKEDAVEKLWDAFERLKTIYTNCDKKQSVTKIVDIISKGNPKYKEIFDTEFQTLSNIGNNFRIRHHETDKTEINDDRYYDYFFSRCVSLISLILGFIK